MEQDPAKASTIEDPSNRHTAQALQDRIAAAFGILPADRRDTVKSMMERSTRGSAGYWLQLLLAMGIASLGLVLGSTAVVIGAMLISPLMGPIVELGMGLAIGSPFLVMRSFIRTVMSIAVVISRAALLTLLLPYHEVTGEIAARTSPTVLDLSIAISAPSPPPTPPPGRARTPRRRPRARRSGSRSCRRSAWSATGSARAPSASPPALRCCSRPISARSCSSRSSPFCSSGTAP